MSAIYWTIEFAVAAAIALGLAALFRVPKAPFRAGVKGAFVGGVIAVCIYAAIDALNPGLPEWVTTVLVAPLIEEVARLWFAVKAQSQLRGPRMWFFCGLGFGALEFVSEIVWTTVNVFQGTHHVDALSYPFISLLMHIFVGVLACGLLELGWRQSRILLVTISIHMLHNWSTVAFEQSYWPLRILLFVLLIQNVLKWGQRFDPVTTEPPHAKAPP